MGVLLPHPAAEFMARRASDDRWPRTENQFNTLIIIENFAVNHFAVIPRDLWDAGGHRVAVV
ncbi:hypothetical protein [Xanthobacter tagetidis]|uniref:hypothetical protein n=1 Tax=Xanthobacter tagetidis TaxID=60216 RepID=UPI0037286786